MTARNGHGSGAGNGHGRRPPGPTAPLRAVPGGRQEPTDLDPDAGARLLGELHAALTRYVVLPSPEAADAVVLWVAATHGQPAFEHAPRLAAVSPEKRCGKSRLMDVIAETCHHPLITVNATIAAIVRALGDDPPTLLVDEADTIFGTKKVAEHNEELRGLLNAGHQRNRPMLRYDITTRSNEHLATFAMAMLAGIGELPDTIMDRAVVVRMRRRAAGEHVAPYRTRRDAPPLNALRDRLATWVRAHLGDLERAEPEMPLEDRTADTWEPLIALGDLAADPWPDRARTAALTLTREASAQATEASLGLRLLADLREVFATDQRLETAEVLRRLRELEEAPWADLFGKPLDARGLARRLAPYGVAPKVVRIGDATPRGYEAADFRDPWARYLASHPQHPQQRNIAGQGVADVADVADTPRASEPTGEPTPVADDGWQPRSTATPRPMTTVGRCSKDDRPPCSTSWPTPAGSGSPSTATATNSPSTRPAPPPRSPAPCWPANTRSSRSSTSTPAAPPP